MFWIIEVLGKQKKSGPRETSFYRAKLRCKVKRLAGQIGSATPCTYFFIGTHLRLRAPGRRDPNAALSDRRPS